MGDAVPKPVDTAASATRGWAAGGDKEALDSPRFELHHCSMHIVIRSIAIDVLEEGYGGGPNCLK